MSEWFMRFVVVSLLTHAAIVVLASRQRAVESPVATAREPTPKSGVLAAELIEAVAAETPEVTRVAIPAQPPATLPSPTPPAAAKSPPSPSPRPETAAPKLGKSAAATRAPPSAVPVPARETDERARSEDWLSVEQQLPIAVEAETPTVPARRDTLVERLLAKERDRRGVLERAERQRFSASRQAAPIRAVGQARGATDSAVEPSTPDVLGESHEQADPWVELTRWLPRAASSDRSWENLATTAAFDFEVELTTEQGRLTQLTSRDARVPAHVRRLLTGTQHLMARGRFDSAARSVYAFKIRIRLSDTAERELRIAHTLPAPPDPGLGVLTLPSGRRLEAYVSRLPR